MKLAAVTNSSEEFLKYLNSRNLKLGAQVKVLHIEPFDGSMKILYNTSEEATLSAIVCEKLLVED